MSDLITVFEGRVVQGAKRSRALGFPTANIEGGTLGLESVYAGRVGLEGVYAGTLELQAGPNQRKYVTAVSIGRRPTLPGSRDQLVLEAHILDFTVDLYGRDVRVELHTRLRPQFRYVDTPTLKRQLHLDVQATRAWALANGLEYLLMPPSDAAKSSELVSMNIRSGPVIRRKNLRGAAKSAERRQLREQRLEQAIDECHDRKRLSPEWLAQRTGLPVGLARWYLESSQKVMSP